MTTVTIIENEYATLLYHEDTKVVHHTFHQPLKGTNHFREVLNKGAEVLEHYGAKKWLSDDRKNEALSPEDGEFGTKDWLPRVAKLGWKYWAMVVPESIAARLDMKYYIDYTYSHGIRVMVFTNPEEAMDWLKTFPD